MDTIGQVFLPFALPDIGDEEISAVTEALRSGWVTWLGDEEGLFAHSGILFNHESPLRDALKNPPASVLRA